MGLEWFLFVFNYTLCFEVFWKGFPMGFNGFDFFLIGFQKSLSVLRVSLELCWHFWSVFSTRPLASCFEKDPIFLCDRTRNDQEQEGTHAIARSTGAYEESQPCNSHSVSAWRCPHWSVFSLKGWWRGLLRGGFWEDPLGDWQLFFLLLLQLRGLGACLFFSTEECQAWTAWKLQKAVIFIQLC